MPAARQERLLVALIVIAAAARCVFLTWLHPVTWDEIEFFRATDWVRHGQVPYRDFWEHHTPLQWFLFAPITALVKGPGVAALILMRWAQVPLWILIFWLIARWMRDAGISLTARLSAILLCLCSSIFMSAAVEYRVDVVGCALYVLALVILQNDRHPWFGFVGGAALCLAGFANIRLGPLLLLTMLLARIVRPRQRAWGGTSSANWVFAGAAGAFALCASYLAATHSATIAFRRVWTENYLGDRLSEGASGVLIDRLAVPFGFKPLDPTQPPFELASFDIATVIVLVVGTIGVVRALYANRRAPDYLFFLAFVQVGNILFVAAMKFIYDYHFEIIVLLMVPFVGAEIERSLQLHRRWSVVLTILLFASATNIFASIFRGKEGDLAYQDVIMREVDRRTAANAKVFDGVGWALRRRPAYHYWFLPMLVHRLESKGVFDSYTPQEMTSEPPAAIITDHRTFVWLEEHPALAVFASSHYLPLWRNLWLPGLSCRLTPDSPSAEWIVPASGAYRPYGSELLSIHPWFRNPVVFGTFQSKLTEIALTGFSPAHRLPLNWSVDGIPIQPNEVLFLRRKQKLRVISRDTKPFGMMIVPTDVRELFRQPPHGVTIDGIGTAETHVPDFRTFFNEVANFR